MAVVQRRDPSAWALASAALQHTARALGPRAVNFVLRNPEYVVDSAYAGYRRGRELFDSFSRNFDYGGGGRPPPKKARVSRSARFYVPRYRTVRFRKRRYRRRFRWVRKFRKYSKSRVIRRR